MFFKKKRIQLLQKVKLDSLSELYNLKNDFNKEIDNLISETSNIYVCLDAKKEIFNISNKIKDKISYGNHLVNYMKTHFNDSKKLFTIIIFLNSGRIKSFDVYENSNLSGFKFNNEYYNIDRDAIVNQNNSSFLFYAEGYAAPINFKSIDYYRDEFGESADGKFRVELSCRNLVQIVDGTAFKGIITLGKDVKSFWETIDIKMVGIALLVGIMLFLHFTGQINLVELFKLK